MQYDLSFYAGKFSEYTELRIQENRSTRIVLVKGDVTTNERNATSGVSARVYSKGSWGFASNPEIDKDTIPSVIEAATSNSVFLAEREKREEKRFPEDPFIAENELATKKRKKNEGESIPLVLWILIKL